MRLLSVVFRYLLLLNHLRAWDILLGVQESRVTKYICTYSIATKVCHGVGVPVPGRAPERKLIFLQSLA